ncbi:MAG TPA: PadR family transcriptional regulator [Gemmatimonadaceae bacterium]|nr:PadR family transcriptional regulator [Gemmatimonadaceae bacterium]
MNTPTSRTEIPPGTLDMLILKTLARDGELHGFEIAQAIERTSVGVFLVEEGSLYPALQRMLVKGWLSGEWGRTSDNRRARYYRATAAGKRQLEQEIREYERAANAISRVLRAAPAGA